MTTPCLRAAMLALALVLAAAPSSGAYADASSRGQAIEQALRQSGGGKVLGVRESREGDTVVYAVKVLTDGRVRVYRIRGR